MSRSEKSSRPSLNHNGRMNASKRMARRMIAAGVLQNRIAAASR
jgi:hypothetical protein